MMVLAISYRSRTVISSAVEIVDSPFAGFSGTVSDISEDGSEITVVVKTAQRDMPIKLEAKNVRRKAD